MSGEGQETQKLVILNGTESWNSWGINAHNPAITGFYTYDINDYDAKNAKGICSHLETPNQDVWGWAECWNWLCDSRIVALFYVQYAD